MYVLCSRADSFLHLSQRADYCVLSVFSVYIISHLVVQIEMVKLSVCPEVLSVSVQGEVDITTVALDHH